MTAAVLSQPEGLGKLDEPEMHHPLLTNWPPLPFRRVSTRALAIGRWQDYGKGSVKPWNVLESRTLLDKRWLRLHEQRVGLPNGNVIDEFHKFETPNWVAVIALTSNREVVVVEQYRHGLGHLSRELPAGVIDPDESPEQAGRRELLEETGHEAELWHPLLEVSPEPHRSTARAHFFVAKGARFTGSTHQEPSEDIRTILVPLEQLLNEATSGRIDHGAHVGALLVAERLRLLV